MAKKTMTLILSLMLSAIPGIGAANILGLTVKEALVSDSDVPEIEHASAIAAATPTHAAVGDSPDEFACEFQSLTFRGEGITELFTYDIKIEAADGVLKGYFSSRQTSNERSGLSVEKFTPDSDQAMIAVIYYEQYLEPESPPWAREAVKEAFGAKIELLRNNTASTVAYYIGRGDSAVVATLVKHFNSDGVLIGTSGMVGWGAMGFCTAP